MEMPKISILFLSPYQTNSGSSEESVFSAKVSYSLKGNLGTLNHNPLNRGIIYSKIGWNTNNVLPRHVTSKIIDF
jgi:hypothetical protein